MANPPPNPNKGPTTSQIQGTQPTTGSSSLSTTLGPALQQLGLSQDQINAMLATLSTAGAGTSTAADQATAQLIQSAQTFLATLSPSQLNQWQQQLAAANLLPSAVGGVSDEATQGATATLIQLMQEQAGAGATAPEVNLTNLQSALGYYNQSLILSPTQQQTQDLSSLEAGYYEMERPLQEQEVQANEPLYTSGTAALQTAQQIATMKSMPSTTANQLLTQATTQFMVPLSQTQAEQWGNLITQGQATTTDFTNWARGQAEALYPSLSQYISKGVDPSTLLQPYVNQAASELELDPATITGNSPYLSPAMLQNPDGSLKNTYAYTQSLRQDPSWRYTGNANDLAASWSAQLAQTFGGVQVGAQAPSSSEEMG